MIKNWMNTLMVWVILLFSCSISSQQMSNRGRVIEIKGEDRSTLLYEQSYALLIGISQYKYNCWNNLLCIPGEIEKLKKVLEQQGFVVQTLLNCTSAQLRNQVNYFISEKGLRKNNRLLIFFSGHGDTRNEGKKGYIIPSDTPSPHKNLNEFVYKAIEMAQIMAWAKKIEAKHALFIFDSCFSGSIFLTRSLPQIPKAISGYSGRPVRQFISAGSADEEIPAKSDFVPYFIRGIKGEADYTKDGYVTASELSLYIHGQITTLKKRQTPQYGKIRDPEFDQGDFIFVCSGKKTDDNNPEGAVIEEKVSKPRIQKSYFESLGKQIKVSKETILNIDDDFQYQNNKKNWYWLCFLDGDRIWPMVKVTSSKIKKNISLPRSLFNGGKIVLACVLEETNEQFESTFYNINNQFPLFKPNKIKIILETTIILK